VKRFTLWQRAALVVGGIGWAWTVVQLLTTAVTLKRDKGPPYPMGEPDRAFEQVHPVYRDLLGPLYDRLGDHETCGERWFGEDTVLIRGIGPRNGSTVPVWMTLTVGGKVFVGRAVIDVWRGLGAGTGGLESTHLFTNGANLRLVERMPPPKPGPPGLRVIRPGECVLGSTKPQDAFGVIGRFLIDLPAERLLRLSPMPDLEGEHVPKDFSLTLDGRTVPKVNMGEFKGDMYRTEHDGRYLLTVRRTDGQDAGTDSKDAATSDGIPWPRYTVQVSWGEAIGGACSPPDRFGNCFREVEE